LEISQIDDRLFFWLLSVLVEDSQAHSLTTRQIMAQDGSATNQQPIVRAIAVSVSALCAPLTRPPPDSQASAAGAGGKGNKAKAKAAAAAAVVAPRQGYYGSDRLTGPMLLEVRQSIAMLEAWLYKAQGAVTLKNRVSTAAKELDGEDHEQHHRRIEVVLRDFGIAFPALVNDPAFVVPSAIEVAGNGGSADGEAVVQETPPAKRQRIENDAAKAATELDAASTTLTAALKTLLGDTQKTARKLANTGLVGLAKDASTVAADEDQGGFVASALDSYVELERASAEADDAVDDLPADGDAV
jgi:hypothetical protein